MLKAEPGDRHVASSFRRAGLARNTGTGPTIRAVAFICDMSLATLLAMEQHYVFVWVRPILKWLQ